MSLSEIHKLTPEGLKLFYDFIIETRSDEAAGLKPLDLPNNLLTDPRLRAPFSKDIIDTKKIFSNRYEMSEYIFTTWKTFHPDHYSEIGVWAWFSVIYFGQLRRTKKTIIKGQASPSTQRTEHFIPDEYNRVAGMSVGYRNAVRYPFQLRELGYPDNFLKFCLVRDSVSDMGDPLESIGSNKKVLQNPALMNLILALYFDPKAGKAKPGVFAKATISKKGQTGKAGSRRLLPLIIPRVKKSYDIHDMSPSELIDACGKEVKTSKWVK